MLLSSEVRELHHDGRADGKYLVDVLLLEELLHTDGHYAFLTIRAIIGHDDHFVRALTNLVFEDNQILRTTGHHGEHSVASSLQCLDDGQHRCYTQSATSTDYGAVFLNLRGIAQRTYHICHIVAFVEGAEFLR